MPAFLTASSSWIYRLRHVIPLGALLACLSLMGCVEKAFYYPDQVVYGSPADQGLPFEPVSFRSKDGTLLSGWFVPAQGVSSPQDAKGTVIHFHGNAENMSAHWSFVSWLPQRGFNVFVFDYRGYGQSQGSPDIKGVFEDANEAINYVRQRPDINPQRLLVFGQSLGGTNAIVAVGAGNRAGVKAVAIEATFFSYSTIANQNLPGAGLLISNQYSAERYIAKLSPIPLLLLHGTADDVISYDHATMLLQQAQAPKTLITVPNGGHIEAMTPRFGDAYRNALVRFFEASIAAQP